MGQIKVTKDVGGEYQGSASAEGYVQEDSTKLVLSEKDQKWGGIKK